MELFFWIFNRLLLTDGHSVHFVHEFLPASLESLLYQCFTFCRFLLFFYRLEVFVLDIKVSIDRLTVVSDEHILLSPVGENIPHVEGLVYLGGGVYTLDYSNGSDSENLAYMSFYNFSKKNTGFRIDFNPNHIERDDIPKKFWDSLDFILSGMSGNQRLSRLDIAFDIPSDVLKDYSLVSSGFSTKYVSRSGRLQTFYVGSRYSDSQIRLYDKRAELAHKGVRTDGSPLWRLELQLRTKKVLTAHDEVMRMLSYLKPNDWSWIDNNKYSAILQVMDIDSSFYSRLSRREKEAIKEYKKIAPNGAISRDLLDAYDKQKTNLNDTLDKYLKSLQIDF